MVATAYPRQFVPADFEPTDVPRLTSLYQNLFDRAINSVSELEQFLADFSELASVVDEYGSRRYIDKSCHTNDESIKQRFLFVVEQIDPKTKPLTFALQQKFLGSPFIGQLNSPRHQILIKRWKAEVELFRKENVAIEMQVTKKVTEYDEINGRMSVEFDGKERTMQQMARYQEDTDRDIRAAAWKASAARRMTDRAAIEDIFDALLPLRQSIAENAGLADFRDYQWKANKRFDYTPSDCLRFADAVAETVVPVMRRLDAQRAVDLKIKNLRPWDISVDPQGRAPLRPFDENNVEDFVARTREVFHRLSPALASDFDQLRTRGNLDLASRKGKQPGGYLMPLEESRQPFIFMNAAGLQRDVETLLHEGGHAFHHLASAGENLVFLRSAPMEFCEVASMSMELLGGEHLEVYYTPADAARARRTHMEGIIRILPWIATIDSFQHWIYTHSKHTRDQRTDEWIRLVERFGAKLDWSGFEDVKQTLWQRQAHLFHAPFYYIEYGIAQLGALQLWLKSKTDSRQALAGYRAALSLGGTKSLPALFNAAGIVFEFSSKTIGPLVQAMEDELKTLPK